MELGDTIRLYRKQQGLTQEQLAAALCVSAGAVNKWERGKAYPDFKLLPVLARRLGVDLNTLLSYQKEMPDEEVYAFASRVKTAIEEEGYDAGFRMALTEVQRYPLSEMLPAVVGGVLEGALFLYDVKEREAYTPDIYKLYEQAAQSERLEVLVQVIPLLAAKYRDKGDFAKAQALLERLPEREYDKSPMQASLYRAQGEEEKAAAILEQQLLHAAMSAQTALQGLFDIAGKAGDEQKAGLLAECNTRLAKTLDLWDYNGYLTWFELAVLKKDAEAAAGWLRKMFQSLDDGWHVNESPLYAHVPAKKEQGHMERMKHLLVRALREEEAISFMRRDGLLVSVLEELGVEAL